MAEIRIKVSSNLLQKLPKKQNDIQKVLRLGLKHLIPRRRKTVKSVVDQTFAAIPIKDHKLIEQVIELSKYGE